MWILSRSEAWRAVSKVFGSCWPPPPTPGSKGSGWIGLHIACVWDAAIPGFVLHWDLDDLVKAMGSRRVLWTDPANWIRTVVFAGPSFRYRYVLGDTTDLADAQDDAYIRDLLH
jgi:hypothetical protein